MLPETLVTLIWTLDQSGVFSWPATRPQKKAAATRANPSKLRISWAMIFLRTVLRILSFDRTNGCRMQRTYSRESSAQTRGGRYNSAARRVSRYRYNRLFFPVLEDGSVVQVLFARAFNPVVDFARGGGGGQRNAELVAEFEGQAQIFVHQAQREAGLVVATQHHWSFYVQDAGARHAGLHDFNQFFSCEACTGDQGQRFGESVHLQSQQQIHGELDGLPSAVWSEMKKFLAHRGKDRASGFESVGFAADHKQQLAFFRAPGASGDGRIQEPNASGLCSVGNFSSERGRDRAGVNINRAFFERGKGAAGFVVGVRAGTPENFFKRWRITNDGDEDIGGGSGFFGRSGEARSCGHQRIGARRGAVPHHQRKSGFEKIVAHGTAHKAESDKTDARLRHDCLR